MKDLCKSWDSQSSIDEVPCIPCNIPEDLDPDVVSRFIHVQVIYRKYHKGPWDTDKVKGHVICI